jgi:hypothetical protein
MKVIALALLLVAGACAKVAVKSTRAEGPACPPEDPLDRPEEGPLNITFHPIAQIDQGGMRQEVMVTGLSTFGYTYDINLIQLTATFSIRVANIDLSSGYTATGYLDARPFTQACIPSGNFTGSGTALVTAAGVMASGSATLFVNLISDKVSIRLLAVDSFSFTSLTVNLGEEYMIGGSPVDWAAFNAGLKACVDTQFAANNAEVVEKIRVGVNEKIGVLSLQEFLDLLVGGGGDGGCDNKF